MVNAIDVVMETMNDETVVIPGHGPVSNKAKLKAYQDMLAGISGKVAALMKEGKSLEEVIAAKPTAEFDEVWAKGFLTPDTFAKIVYNGLAEEE
jgi:hypothetical protein